MAKRGRPRGAPSEVVNVRLAVTAYDEACRIALRRGIPLSTLLRESLEELFVGKKSTTEPPARIM